MKKGVFIIGFLCLFINHNNAQQTVEELKEVVVTATKFPTKKEQVGKVIYRITQKEIVNNAGKTILDILNTIPGIEIKGSNTNPSEPRSTYIRGGRSRQVLVLIDGIPVSDPSLINQEYDLRLVSLQQIQRIEVLKGASSTLYGSGAATGVINIILKKAPKNDFSVSYETSIGTNNSANSSSSQLSNINQNIQISGASGNFNFLSTFGVVGTKGMSAAKSTTNEVFEEDLYQSTSGLLKLGYKFNKSFSVSSFLNFDEFEYDYDAGIYTDSYINNGNQSQIRFGIQPRFIYAKGEVYLLASFNNVKRTNINFNSYSNTEDSSVFKGESVNIDVVNKYTHSDKIHFIMGANYQNHANNSTTPFGNIDREIANFTTIDPYASLVFFDPNGIHATIGGRLNMHSNYGNHFVYDASISKQIVKKNDLNLRGLFSFSSAFIAPSTYQLYSPYGNTNLDPETSETQEIGFDFEINKWLFLNTVYFHREENKSIIYTSLTSAPWGVYENTSEVVKVSGLETEITLKPLEKVKLNLGYTYTDKNKDIDYIPTHKFTANVEFYPTKKSFVSLVYKNVGDRFARYFDSATSTTEATTLPQYNLLNLHANCKILGGTLTLFGSVTNLLNTDYEDVLGYETRGRNVMLGIRLNF